MPRNKSSPKGITESAGVNPISIGWALSVANYLSFRGAARELGVRPTAVSRRVGALENALGVSLFERSPRGLKITTAGFRFIQDVREGFRYIEHATRMAGAAGVGKSGRLSIGIQPSMGAGFFRELFRAYTDQHPGVTFDWAEGAPPTEHVSLVERRLLDVAIVSDTTEVGGCESVALWTERLFVALPEGHFLAKRGTVDWQDLRGERFIIREAKCDPALCERLTRHVSDRNRSPVMQPVGLNGLSGPGCVRITELILRMTRPPCDQQFPSDRSADRLFVAALGGRVASREASGALHCGGDRRARPSGDERQLSRLGIGLLSSLHAARHFGLWLRDGGVFEPQAGTGDL